MFKLKIITSTVREGRSGIYIGEWVKKQSVKFCFYDVELIDLGELDLPLSKEPNHPVLQKYHYEPTIKWSRTINEADAFIFVLAEYNHSFPAALKNALDTLSKEWSYKPAAIVSYAGISGGVRSSSGLSHILSALRMVPIPEGIIFPFYTEHLDKETGTFEPGEPSEHAAGKMLDELLLWTRTLAQMRQGMPLHS